MLTLTSLLSLGLGPALAQTPDDVVDLPQDIIAPVIPQCPDALWPGEAWPNRAATVGRAQADAVGALDAYLFPPDLVWDSKEREGVRTDAALIVHRGTIIYEHYRDPWSADTPHPTWSVSKSVLNALVGIAVQQGRLELGDSICDHLRPERPIPDASCAVTVQHLLDMGSGFQWQETYGDASPTSSSVLAMLYGEGSADMATFTASQPLVREPGSAWQYSSGDSNVLSAVVGAALTEPHGERFPWATLFDPIGMNATFERDDSGTYVGSSHLWATPRDLARFGYLYLHEGCWNGEAILPEGWVDFSVSFSEGIQREAVPELGPIAQARLFWVNETMPQMPSAWCPDVPPEMYAALGIRGQSVTMLPEHDAVIVRLADDRDSAYEHNEMVKRALAILEAR